MTLFCHFDRIMDREYLCFNEIFLLFNWKFVGAYLWKIITYIFLHQKPARVKGIRKSSKFLTDMKPVGLKQPDDLFKVYNYKM